LRDQKRRTDAGENERELLGVIDEEADRLNKYIDNLLAMARIEAGELGLQRSAAPVEGIVAEGLQRLRPSCARSRVNVRVAEALPLLDVDSRAVAHVIHILVDNACNHVLDGPVSVSADRTNNGELCLSVEDQGPGIPPELRERVFERFFRIQEAVLSDEREPVRISRTGMGLAIAREIVQAHGGKIWIEDAESGQGTKVLFTIPFASRRISSPADAQCIEQWRRFLAQSAGTYPPASQNSHSG
jgi:two-component system sensor histidine kinase KdpD